MISPYTSDHGILGQFLKWERAIPHDVFLRQPDENNWKQYTWKAVGETARKVAFNLQALGLEKGSRIAILSQNCAEWIICDLAIMMGGYISVPLYSNVNGQNFTDIIRHSESKFLFIGKLLQKDWECIRSVIPPSLITVTMRGYKKDPITTWESFNEHHPKQAPIVLPSLDDLLTIIYTSGTTGEPKGVVHTYGSTIKAVEAASSMVLLNRRGNRFFSYLPISHAAERGLVEFGAIFSGGSISFVNSPDKFLSTIQQVAPTHFLAVPRIWEKFQTRILEKISQKKIDLFLPLPLIGFLLKKRIRRSLGLHKARAIFSGAAFISPALISWFGKFDIRIQEAYGMSENFNVCSLNPRSGIRIGSVGKLYENQEVKIDPDTHEVLQRCEWQMKGYYKNPELTVATIINGFLHTGDMGELSSDGYLSLSGRLKDVFKTSKGEYILPVETERYFSSLPEVDQACLLGQQYPQPFLIVVLSESGKTLAKDFLNQSLTSALLVCNENKMEYQRIKKVIIVLEEWTNENSLLTPTFKIKRNALSLKYESKLLTLYNREEAVSYE
ncbi:MAG: AMP-binding protein [Cyclobacteriaceae bacterium]